MTATDKTYADEVRKAANELNQSIQLATRAGLEVYITVFEITAIEKRAAEPRVDVIVKRDI